MQVREIENVIACPVCGSNVALYRNASKDFQIRCQKCGARTGWRTKTNAVIEWYNMVLQYMKNKAASKE